MSPADEKMWSTLTHIGGIFFGFIAPLIGYLLLKDRGPFVRAHTAAALNFQLTVLIAYVLSVVLVFAVIGIALVFVVWALNIGFSIAAAVAANSGRWYTYRIAITFVR